MLGYSENDLEEMIGGIQIAKSTLEKGEDNEEVLEWLSKTMELLQALWDKGYFK